MIRTLLTTATVTVALTAGVTIAGAGTAAADVASPHASCVGLGLSDHAVQDGPGAIADSVDALRSVTGAFRFRNNGQVISRWAGVHAGTHDPGCEQALLAVLVTGP